MGTELNHSEICVLFLIPNKAFIFCLSSCVMRMQASEKVSCTTCGTQKHLLVGVTVPGPTSVILDVFCHFKDNLYQKHYFNPFIPNKSSLKLAFLPQSLR